MSNKPIALTPSVTDLLAMFADPPSSLSLASALTPGASALMTDLGIGGGRVTKPQVKRKVYFAFRYKDIMRVNNVRQSGKIGLEEDKNPRDFYDRSIWEKRAISDPDSLKRLMREGVEHSSVVCVLSGSDTYDSRWVKYEIARAVVDNRGLLNVDINELPSHQTGRPDTPALNTLEVMGIYHDFNEQFYLWEKRLDLVSVLPARYEWRWHRYEDYTNPVSIPAYLSDPAVGYIRPLSDGARSRSYVRDLGYQNIGQWIDFAASQVGR
jgi:hypothetical protein